MASRFWAAQGASESEDDSDSREEESDNEQEIKVPAKFGKGGAASDSEEEEVVPQKRVVRSARDRTIEELQNTVNKIKNAMNINDWSVIHTEFDKLNKQLQKAQTVLSKEGTPRFYFKTLVTLEDFVKKTHENKDKKMTTTNQKAFNTFKNFLKKHNKTYEKNIEDYRKNPDEEEKKRSDNNAEEEEEDDFFDAPAPAKAKPAAPVEEDDEEEDEEEEEEESDEDSDEDASGPSKWMLKAGEKKEEPKKNIKEKKDKEPKDRTKKAPKKVQPTEVEKKPVEMNEEDIKKKLADILAARGKRNTDPLKQIQNLGDLVNYASNKGAELQLELLTHLISSQFDVNRSATGSMPVAMWKSCHDNLNKMLNILEQNPGISLHDLDVDEKPATFPTEAESENMSSFEMEEEQELKLVSGNLVAFIQRLDDEYTKSLQSIDPHTKDYIQRLQDETSFLDLAERAQTYYDKSSKPRQAARIAARRVEHMYYKSDAHSGVPAAEAKDDSMVLLDKLAHLIYNHGDERSKTRTILCQIYHHSLHDRFYQARDMMLMSHLQESIGRTDIPTQILFNRTMVQLGLCAFRNNLIKQAHSCLMEICSSRRIKELLAQGTNTNYTDRTPDQEKLERKRQLPYHMHINLDLVDAVHLISAMLLEIPNMAQNALDTKKKVISRTFRNLLDYFERQVFTGPPENTRDVIMTAAKNLQRGEWKQTVDLLLGLPIWAFLQNSDKVKEALKRKIQEEGLRTYIFTYSSYYDSMSLDQLAESFSLSKNTIHSLVSKMMISEELHAAWDQPTAAIVMHKAEATRLQYLALQLAEKAATFVENNERLLEAKTGQPSGQTTATYGYKDGKQQQKDRWQDQKQQRGQKQSGNRNQQQRYQNQGQRKGQTGGRNQQQNRERNYNIAY